MMMNDELKRRWKEAVVVYYNILSQQSLNGQKKATKNFDNGSWSPNEIQTFISKIQSSSTNYSTAMFITNPQNVVYIKIFKVIVNVQCICCVINQPQ
jgi:hypothetical protein